MKEWATTIVIPNRNGEKIIEKCLRSIESQSIKNIEIIVVDNGSADRSIDIVRTFPSVKLIINKSNLGFTGGNWIGINNANSEYVAFINTDTILETDWIKCMLSLIKSDPTIGAVAGKVLKPNGNIDSLGGLIYYPSGRSCDREYESSEIENLISLPGSAFMVKKSIALKVGFLDIDYFVMYDETDFFWRLRSAGYKCTYSPTAISWHIHGYSFLTDVNWTPNKRRYYLIRNMIWSNIKNLDRKYIVPFILYEMAFTLKQTIIFYLFLINKNTRDYIKVYFIAILETFLNIKKIIEKRKKMQLIKKIPDDELLKYYPRNNDLFSKLILRLMRLK